MRTHSGPRVAWYKVVGFGSLVNLGVCCALLLEWTTEEMAAEGDDVGTQLRTETAASRRRRRNPVPDERYSV